MAGPLFQKACGQLASPRAFGALREYALGPLDSSISQRAVINNDGYGITVVVFVQRPVMAPLSLVNGHCAAPEPVHDRQPKALLVAGLRVEAVERQGIQPTKRRE